LDDPETDVSSNEDTLQKQDQQKVHWLVHFDINETILVGDEVGGDSVSDCYNKMIAKSAFVQIPRGEGKNEGKEDQDFEYDYDNTSALKPTHWWDGSPINDDPLKTQTDSKMNDDNNNNDKEIPPLYTGWTWPKGCCPYYRTFYKRISKTFVDHHGSIYRPIHNQIVEKMSPTNHDESIFRNILPAFFHTVYHLVHKNQNYKDGSPLTIVFRTFGTDLPHIAKAMTAFALGKHPEYPDFVHPEYELDTRRLYNAKWVQDPGSSSNDRESFQYQLYRQEDGHMVASGDEQVLNLLHDTTSTTGYYNVYGIRDDYNMWKNHNWEPWAGKPVWMTEYPSSSGDNASHHHHHVLFDDNIHNLPHDGIASVRRRKPSANTSTDDHYESLSGEEILKMHGLHLIRVPTIEPILNLDWFLQQLEKVQLSALKSFSAS